MDIRLDGSPAYRTATCVLGAGESVLAEQGAMSMMSDGVAVSTGTGGGLAKGLWRKAVGGEGLILARYTADWHGAWVQVAPKFPGDVTGVDAADGWTVESGAFLAMSATAEMSAKVTGVRTAVMKEGLTMLRFTGSGQVLVCAYGALQTVHIKEGMSVTVDTGHLVGWSARVSTKTGLLGSLVKAKLSGEMLVTRCTGPGTLLVQSRAEAALHGWLAPGRGQNTGT